MVVVVVAIEEYSSYLVKPVSASLNFQLEEILTYLNV